MTSERWQQIDEMYHAALERDASQRAAFLSQACSGDTELRDEVESLIASHEHAGSFIAEPALKVAAKVLAEDQAISLVGRIISHYRIESLLGAGGMGEVYLAEDTELGRKVALKFLPAYVTRDAERLRRFAQEARAASALNHPNIITIHEVGQADPAHFIATEFIDGETLRHHMTESPSPAASDVSPMAGTRMRLDEVLDIAGQIVSALAAAHEAGIVHRDIKPENVMLRRDRIVKVLDFGLAKLAPQPTTAVDAKVPAKSVVKTNPGAVMGTAQYMSPEQARGLDVDARTDIWSLGVVLYEMVTGRAPFEGETPSHVIVSILESELPPLARYAEVPVELERIVTKALRKNREERYQTASDLALDLKNLKQEIEVEARLEHSIQSDVSGREAVTKCGGQAAVASGQGMASRTVDIGAARPPSGAEYLVFEINRHKQGAILATVAAVIAVAAVAYFFYSARSGEVSDEAIDSIAVLPFVNVSADPTAEYLSVGISDSINKRLSRLPNLKVISLNAVLRYKGRQVDPHQIGREMNVRAVLMGRLMQQGDSLAISTELVDVRDNRRLWGEQYSRKLSDILAVQDEVAREISVGLRLRLSGEEMNLLTKHYTENPEAYLLYQQGRALVRSRTRAGTEKGIEYLEEAIKKDPAYALARVWLAWAYSDVSSPLPFKEIRPKVESLLLKALELDDDLAEAHALLGGLRLDDGDWPAAERECKRALDLDPNSVMAHGYYAAYLQQMGRHDEAIAVMKRAQELDPLSVILSANVGLQLYFARRYDQAIEQLKKAIEIDPNFAPAHARLGATYVQKGMYEEAILELEKARALDNSPERPGRFAWLAYAYAVSGRRDKAQQMLAELKEQAKQRQVPSINFAIIYTGLGKKDQAFAWLEKVYEERRGRELRDVRVDPMFDNLRSDPRFTDLLRRGLAP